MWQGSSGGTAVRGIIATGILFVVVIFLPHFTPAGSPWRVKNFRGKIGLGKDIIMLVEGDGVYRGVVVLVSFNPLKYNLALRGVSFLALDIILFNDIEYIPPH